MGMVAPPGVRAHARGENVGVWAKCSTCKRHNYLGSLPAESWIAWEDADWRQIQVHLFIPIEGRLVLQVVAAMRGLLVCTKCRDAALEAKAKRRAA